ncbi:MAG: hypothetical protein ACI9BD_000293 [Candidatus Marinamargulisbacteria bacterium]|jgi:hypothetical protein
MRIYQFGQPIKAYSDAHYRAQALIEKAETRVKSYVSRTGKVPENGLTLPLDDGSTVTFKGMPTKNTQGFMFDHKIEIRKPIGSSAETFTSTLSYHNPQMTRTEVDNAMSDAQPLSAKSMMPGQPRQTIGNESNIAPDRAHWVWLPGSQTLVKL